MLIAHLPSGYIVGRAHSGGRDRRMMLVALIGSVFPDIDMLYFHLIDGRQTHHHYYITHWPLLYVFTLFVSVSVWRRSPRLSSICMMFSAAALVHMVLDSVAAPIKWMAPFSEHTIELVTVPGNAPKLDRELHDPLDVRTGDFHFHLRSGVIDLRHEADTTGVGCV